MSVAAVFQEAGIDVSEELLEEMAAEALQAIRPAFLFHPPDEDLSAVLGQGGFDLSEPTGQEINRAVAAEAMALMAALADTMSVPEAALRLGVDASRVRQRLTRRSLYGVKTARGWRLPTWQFTRSGVLTGTEVLVGALDPALDVVTVGRFMTTGQEDLIVGGDLVTPVEWLAAGRDPAAVADLARFLLVG